MDNAAKLDAAISFADAILRRADSSPDVEAMKARQAARKALAEKGISEAEQMLSRYKDILKAIKQKVKAGEKSGVYYSSPQGYQLDRVKTAIVRCKSSYGLAIYNLSVSYDCERWLKEGDSLLANARQELRDLEGRV